MNEEEKERMWESVSSSFEAVAWYRKAVCGDAEAQFVLGCMFKDGKGVVQSPQRGAEWFQKAAERGDAEAQLHLGSMYENGHGVQEDLAQAFQWYLKAAKQGHPESQYRLGRMFCLGIGSQEESADRHQLAAESRRFRP